MHLHLRLPNWLNHWRQKQYLYIYIYTCNTYMLWKKMELKSGKEWEFYFITLFTILRVGDNIFKRKIYGKRNYKSKDIFIKSIQLFFFYCHRLWVIIVWYFDTFKFPGFWSDIENVLLHLSVTKRAVKITCWILWSFCGDKHNTYITCRRQTFIEMAMILYGAQLGFHFWN